MYQVVDARDNLSYRGLSRAAVRWHLDNVPGSRVVRDPDGHFSGWRSLVRRLRNLFSR